MIEAKPLNKLRPIMPQSVNEPRTYTHKSTEGVPSNDLIRSLYRAIPKMPKPARQFAYNLIELMESNAMTEPPMGDHPLQRPEVLFRRQMDALERALR
jgi:hypothetical protein